MRGEAAVLAGWAALLGVLAVGLWLWTDADVPPALLAGAAAVALAAGLIARTRPRVDGPRARGGGGAAVAAALGVTMIVAGVAVGTWLILPGLGVLGLALLAWRR